MGSLEAPLTFVSVKERDALPSVSMVWGELVHATSTYSSGSIGAVQVSAWPSTVAVAITEPPVNFLMSSPLNLNWAVVSPRPSVVADSGVTVPFSAVKLPAAP